jgi:hypothetical protein
MVDPYRQEVYDQTMTLLQTLMLLAGGDCSDEEVGSPRPTEVEEHISESDAVFSGTG